jgi:hypothetical protein
VEEERRRGREWSIFLRAAYSFLEVTMSTLGRYQTQEIPAKTVGNPKIVDILLHTVGIDPNLGSSAQTPTFLAMLNNQSEIVKPLVGSADIAVNIGSQSQSPLHYAAGAGNGEIVKVLLRTQKGFLLRGGLHDRSIYAFQYSILRNIKNRGIG